MEQVLNEVLRETLRLLDDESEAEYEAFVELTNLRDQLLERVRQRPLLDKEKILLREILQHDDEMMRRMLILKREAEIGMQRLNNSKRQQGAYGNAGFSESIMFDKGV